MDDSLSHMEGGLKMMMKQVIIVLQKGIELLKKKN